MGVIAFRKPELFASRTSRFGVDSYWGLGLRYRGPQELPERIRALSQDLDALRAESFRSSAMSKRLFSEEAVLGNWFKVLKGTRLTRRGCFSLTYLLSQVEFRTRIVWPAIWLRGCGCLYEPRSR